VHGIRYLPLALKSNFRKDDIAGVKFLHFRCLDLMFGEELRFLELILVGCDEEVDEILFDAIFLGRTELGDDFVGALKSDLMKS
jgi:hypothetical protein